MAQNPNPNGSALKDTETKSVELAVYTFMFVTIGVEELFLRYNPDKV